MYSFPTYRDTASSAGDVIQRLPQPLRLTVSPGALESRRSGLWAVLFSNPGTVLHSPLAFHLGGSASNTLDAFRQKTQLQQTAHTRIASTAKILHSVASNYKAQLATTEKDTQL